MASIINQTEFKKLARSLKEFAPRIQKNVVIGATRAGANVVRDEMRDRVSKDTGMTRKSIKTKKLRKSTRTLIVFGVSATKENRAKARWLEYGTINMSPRPFVRPSLTGVGDKPLKEARAYFIPRLEKEKRKLGFK